MLYVFCAFIIIIIRYYFYYFIADVVVQPRNVEMVASKNCHFMNRTLSSSWQFPCALVCTCEWLLGERWGGAFFLLHFFSLLLYCFFHCILL